jgi:hypothetical protein
MSNHQVLYETLLCAYSNQLEAINLLKQYRPYFELIPSLRRAIDSVITIPLPVVKITNAKESDRNLQIDCDVALLMCDPEWKIKTGKEIFIFIHRPEEEFSQLLNRWRQVEVTLGEEYSWLLPWKHQQIMNDKGDYLYPLFVTCSYTPDRIKRGLLGASLPTIAIDSTDKYTDECADTYPNTKDKVKLEITSAQDFGQDSSTEDCREDLSED